MMVGLRMLEGVQTGAFREQFGVAMEDIFGQQLHKMTSAGLLEKEGAVYRLSRQGILFGNDVFGEFVGVLTEV
ncbi:Oxygen-independent coproporphyrinogen-III oxidase 1 [compost metagenome]